MSLTREEILAIAAGVGVIRGSVWPPGWMPKGLSRACLRMARKRALSRLRRRCQGLWRQMLEYEGRQP